MSKPDDLTSVTRAILSDEEAMRICNRFPLFSEGHRALLNAFASKAGVTGERWEGFAEQKPGITPFFHICEEEKPKHCQPATLYIRPPASAKKSAEERIEDALAVHQAGWVGGGHCECVTCLVLRGKEVMKAHNTGECNCRQCRILRGEE